MLGWWVDEAKGYQLEDLENSKLIASQDVCFFEDDSPSELTVIEVGNSTSNKDINKFINNAIEKEIIKPHVGNVGSITTEDSPSLSTASPPDIPKDSVLSRVIKPTESLSTLSP